LLLLINPSTELRTGYEATGSNVLGIPVLKTVFVQVNEVIKSLYLNHCNSESQGFISTTWTVISFFIDLFHLNV
uniref:hypothetical protein n=1 Tax=Flavobacterium sp. TaxID=239 RepID=UPI00404B4D64